MLTRETQNTENITADLQAPLTIFFTARVCLCWAGNPLVTVLTELLLILSDSLARYTRNCSPLSSAKFTSQSSGVWSLVTGSGVWCLVTGPFQSSLHNVEIPIIDWTIHTQSLKPCRLLTCNRIVSTLDIWTYKVILRILKKNILEVISDGSMTVPWCPVYPGARK